MKNKEKINSYLTFELNKELFAIHVKNIISILEMQKITKIPETDDDMIGIIDIRGEAIPVIDSHIKLKLAPIQINTKTSIIVLDIKKENAVHVKIGFIVDKVVEVLQIQKKNILAPPNYGKSNNYKFISGVYLKNDNQFIMIIDIQKILYGSVENIFNDIEHLKSETQQAIVNKDTDI